MRRVIVALLVAALASACGGGGGGGGDDGPTGIGLTDLDGDGNIYVIAFGDSITRGQGDGDSPNDIPPVGVAGYPARFRDLAGVPVANFGVPGERTSSGLQRLPGVLAKNPADFVIILEGINDILPGREVDTIGNLQRMVDAVFAAGAQPILGTLTPSCCNHSVAAPLGTIHRVNAEIVAMAGAHAAELTAATGAMVEIPVIDFFAALQPTSVPPAPPPPPIDASSGLLYEEGLHLTPAGYDAMAVGAFTAFFGSPPPTMPVP